MKILETSAEMLSNDGVAYASVFAGNLSLLLSILIGVIATFLVFSSAKKMGGGLFGSVLKYIGAGMVFVLLGTLTVFIQNWTDGPWFDIFNMVTFSSGFILMVLGAKKLLTGIMNT